jgi:DNA-binding GntR family transcriptional regulator
MQPTWAEQQIIAARRLGLLRALKPGAWRVYDTVLALDLDRNEPVRIARIAAAAKVSRSVVSRALGELAHLGMIERLQRSGAQKGDVITAADLRGRLHTLAALRRGAEAK